VGDEIRQILGNIFITDIFIPEAGLLTVTEVNVTEDLKLAKVYVSFLENKIPKKDLLTILKEKKLQIRHLVGEKLALKYIPQFRFFYDETLEQAERIDNLIGKLHQND